MISTRHSFRSVGTPLASAVFSACVVFLLFGARLTDAGPAVPRAHGAVAADVSVDGRLVKEGGGWAIQFRALNASARSERCTVAASLTRTVDRPMSRVIRTPEEIWTSSVALTVPASGESVEKLQIPADIAKQIEDPQAGIQKAAKAETGEPAVTAWFGVRFSTECAQAPDRVS
jgi:hypothetical protein